MTVNLAHRGTAGADGSPWHWPVPADPGDLSRRLAARRAELRLSVSQVASRAQIEPRYLAYLENFPGHPDAATLRQLAAALRTTSASLLGAGQEAPPGRDPEEAASAPPNALRGDRRGAGGNLTRARSNASTGNGCDQSQPHPFLFLLFCCRHR